MEVTELYKNAIVATAMPFCSRPSLRKHRSSWRGETWGLQAVAETTQVRPVVPAGKNENPFSEMLLSTDSKLGKKRNMSDSEFLFSYGSADSGRHRKWSEHNTTFDSRTLNFLLWFRYLENIFLSWASHSVRRFHVFSSYFVSER